MSKGNDLIDERNNKIRKKIKIKFHKPEFEKLISQRAPINNEKEIKYPLIIKNKENQNRENEILKLQEALKYPLKNLSKIEIDLMNHRIDVEKKFNKSNENRNYKFPRYISDNTGFKTNNKEELLQGIVYTCIPSSIYNINNENNLPEVKNNNKISDKTASPIHKTRIGDYTELIKGKKKELFRQYPKRNLIRKIINKTSAEAYRKSPIVSPRENDNDQSNENFHTIEKKDYHINSIINSKYNERILEDKKLHDQLITLSPINSGLHTTINNDRKTENSRYPNNNMKRNLNRITPDISRQSRNQNTNKSYHRSDHSKQLLQLASMKEKSSIQKVNYTLNNRIKYSKLRKGKVNYNSLVYDKNNGIKLLQLNTSQIKQGSEVINKTSRNLPINKIENNTKIIIRNLNIN